MQTQSKKNIITVASGGCLNTSLLPYFLVKLKSFYDVDIKCALSAEAQNFLQTIALQAITRSEVYINNAQMSAEHNSPLHIEFAKTDLLVVFPATPRIIAESALGIISDPVTRLIAFFPKDKILIAPAIHPELYQNTYLNHLATLEKIGCTIIKQGNEFSEQATWNQVENQISILLKLSAKEVCSEIVSTRSL